MNVIIADDDPTMVALLSEALRADVTVPPHPQEMGAFGAALAARDGAVSVGPGGDAREPSAAPAAEGPDDAP